MLTHADQNGVHYAVKSTKDLSGLLDLKNKFDLSKVNLFVDLNDLRFVTPLHVTLLAQHLIVVSMHGCARIILNNIPDYLRQIGFLEFCNTNHISPATQTSIASTTSMPLKRISKVTMTDYITMSKNFLKQYCPNKDLFNLGTGISELINNVDDHSRSPVDAYIFAQFYPKTNQVKLAVSDAGVGIPNSVNGYLKGRGEDILSPTECVEWAFQNENTIKSTKHNKGLGLSTILSFLRVNRGELRLLTQSAGKLFSDGQVRYFPYPESLFSGTVVEITLNIDNLQNIDEDEFSFDA